MGVTIRDIAKHVGVSHATVSRALNHKNDPFISESTRRRVIVAAREMGYKTNASARALITGRTFNLGLLAESIQERTDPHFAMMLKAVELKARSLGYRVGVFGDMESIVGESCVDGVVVIADPDDPRYRPLADGIASIFVFSHQDLSDRCVSWSDCKGAFDAVQYLVKLGHRKIAGIFGDISLESTGRNHKVAGFRKALQEAGIPCREYVGELNSDQFENGYLLAGELLRDQDGITAVLARNDFLALGAMKAFRQAGIVIPKDISVIGYSDTILARCSDPALTSVSTPIAEAGETAVEYLVRAIETGVMDFSGRVMSTSLTIRDSCAPPNGQFGRSGLPLEGEGGLHDGTSQIRRRCVGRSGR